LRQVGDAWAKGRIGIAQEHLVSAALRTLLGSMLRLSRVTERHRVVFATLEGELHEFGLLSAALLAAAARTSPVYLGPNIPVADVLDAVRRTSAVAVVVAIVTERTDADAIKGIEEIVRGAGSRVEVLVGGARGRPFIARAAAVGARWVDSLEEFAAECRRMAAAR
jgi:methanogenic corrinoid protein MtbC1